MLAAVALAVPVLLVRTAPPAPLAARGADAPQRVVPPAELPPVEPVAFRAVDPGDARAFNAAVPFSTAPNPPARPFRLAGDDASRARATDCLAAAAIYEAGDDTDGQRAVVQVVLNRVRHPAYPGTVCGVVFQGSERRTGCQFTFTCDGAIARPVAPAAWDRARYVARAALAGAVDARVGHATHYHTDWVVPYWSSSLDKIVEVRTHLFFRWTGWWGTPPAFTGRYAGGEPLVAALARSSPAHAGAAALPTAPIDPAIAGMMPASADPDTATFLVTLDPRMAPELFPQMAERACGDRPYCKVMAWRDRAATPAALPVTPAQQRAMAFSYLRDRAFGFDKPLWNCTEYRRPEPNQCMKAQVSLSMAPPPITDFTYDAAPGSALRAIAGAAAAQQRPLGPDPLTGVRRRTDPPAPVPMREPAPTPTPDR